MEWKLERSIREQALLKAQLTQMEDSLKQVQLERDEYVELKSQEAQSLQQQPDPYLGHLQQYMATYQQQVAAYQQLTSEKEALHRELPQQIQLMNQLQQQETWGKVEHLEAASQQNQQLMAQLRLMALPGEGEAAGAAGDGVVACADHNKHSKFLATAQNPAHEPSPGAPPHQELGAADQQGDVCEVSLTDSAEPAQGEAKEGSPNDDPTAQLIVQDHQEHPGLGSNHSVPFFCWARLRRRRR
ncbi:PREDICTED: putative golgin subfamily A member 8E [Colobus angolensis palliatus]|uniref:putative golgin subfamily A member 8E n=1 Tax=Colobus angolensis palliatus TaxID=336983 RepID=UPI0005F406D9|nr:PREDICTED: putative golgin subfamily A member 8E [Colobus angolensis palliatus]